MLFTNKSSELYKFQHIVITTKEEAEFILRCSNLLNEYIAFTDSNEMLHSFNFEGCKLSVNEFSGFIVQLATLKLKLDLAKRLGRNINDPNREYKKLKKEFLVSAGLRSFLSYRDIVFQYGRLKNRYHNKHRINIQ